MQSKSDVAIVGGGLVGSLLAVFLLRRGYGVTVWEQRSDLRGSGEEGGRSINLALAAPCQSASRTTIRPSWARCSFALACRRAVKEFEATDVTG